MFESCRAHHFQVIQIALVSVSPESRLCPVKLGPSGPTSEGPERCVSCMIEATRRSAVVAR